MNLCQRTCNKKLRCWFCAKAMTHQTFDLMKTSSSRVDLDKYIRLSHTFSEHAFKTSSRRYGQDQYMGLGHTSSARLQDVLKTFRRCLQDVLPRRLQDDLQKRLQDMFKTFSRRFQDVFKLSCKDILKIISRRIIKLNCSC